IKQKGSDAAREFSDQKLLRMKLCCGVFISLKVTRGLLRECSECSHLRLFEKTILPKKLQETAVVSKIPINTFLQIFLPKALGGNLEAREAIDSEFLPSL
ncbi:hypothetical protein Ocin01_18117, partial [Orchesella cincta]